MCPVISRIACASGTVAPVVHQFILERSPETFHRGVVPAISLAAHGCGHAKLLQQFLVIMRAVLAAAIRVENQAPGRTLGGSTPEQRLHDQVFRHPLAHAATFPALA